MPSVIVYIRAEYAKLWESLPNKSAFLAETLENYKKRLNESKIVESTKVDIDDRDNLPQ